MQGATSSKLAIQMAAARKLGSVQRSAAEPPDATELFKRLGIDKAETYAAKAGAQSSAAKGTLYYLLGGQLEKVRSRSRSQSTPHL
jgi:hypothetical protein